MPDSDFYVTDDDIIFINDMCIRGELDVMFEALNLPLSREECPAYSTLRSQYIKKKFWKIPNMLKFTELLTSENKSELQKSTLCL